MPEAGAVIQAILCPQVFLALGELLLSCNWAVVADILLPAGSLQISPYLSPRCSPILTRRSFPAPSLRISSWLGCA